MFEEVRKKEIHSVYRHYDELHFIFIRSLIFLCFHSAIRFTNNEKSNTTYIE